MFPARAGMSPNPLPPVPVGYRVPRASGDEPAITGALPLFMRCSPRERG